ncbi:hypothetical protein ACFVUS_33115 [Nocardia sp. NPDC058058]|uniref:hypothetical protein n=1 Tax=Nocardia sp. NPDC058058 TaxID=3346317 RepID=UPI0036DAEE9E
MSALTFDDPADADLMAELDRRARLTAGSGWRHLPYRQVGDTVVAFWCDGWIAEIEPPGSCRNTDDSAHLANQRVIGIATNSATPPAAAGARLDVLSVPADIGAWFVNAHIRFRESKGTSGDPAISIAFGHPTLDPGSDHQREWLAEPVFTDPPTYQVSRDTTVTLDSTGPAMTELRALVSSPEIFRDRWLAELDRLELRVHTTIAAHQARTCDESYGSGGARRCDRVRPLDASEETESDTRAARYFAATKQTVRTSYGDLYSALVAAYPFKELGG